MTVDQRLWLIKLSKRLTQSPELAKRLGVEITWEQTDKNFKTQDNDWRNKQ